MSVSKYILSEKEQDALVKAAAIEIEKICKLHGTSIVSLSPDIVSMLIEAYSSGARDALDALKRFEDEAKGVQNG